VEFVLGKLKLKLKYSETTSMEKTISAVVTGNLEELKPILNR